MNNCAFSLQPFLSVGANSHSPLLPDFQITGNISRHDNTLAIRYEVLGSLGELNIPTLTDKPSRKNELWKTTCFEFFLAVKNAEEYWEFNLSPSGDWNIYRFSGYRQGMAEEMVFTSFPFRVQQRSNSWLLALEFDLDQIVQARQILEVAISAVIQLREGEVTYWALTHPGSQADFHQRDSFRIELMPTERLL